MQRDVREWYPLNGLVSYLFQEPLHFSFHIFLFDTFPFIVVFFPLGQANFNFCQPVLKMNTQGDECITFLLEFGFYFPNLSFLQQ